MAGRTLDEVRRGRARVKRKTRSIDGQTLDNQGQLRAYPPKVFFVGKDGREVRPDGTQGAKIEPDLDEKVEQVNPCPDGKCPQEIPYRQVQTYEKYPDAVIEKSVLDNIDMKKVAKAIFSGIFIIGGATMFLDEKD